MAGLYALTQRLLGAPLALLGKSVLHVYLGRAAELRRAEAPLRGLFLKSLVRTLAVGLIIVLPLALIGSYLVGTVFGPEWSDAGTYLRILLPLYLLNFFASGVGPTLTVTERQDLQLVREIIRSIMVLGTLAWAVQRQLPVEATLILYSIVGSVGYLLFIFTAWTAIRHPRRAAQPPADRSPGPAAWG